MGGLPLGPGDSCLPPLARNRLHLCRLGVKVPFPHLLGSFGGLSFRVAFVRNPGQQPRVTNFQFFHFPVPGSLHRLAAVLASLPSAELHLLYAGAPHLFPGPVIEPPRALSGHLLPPSGPPTGCGGREVERSVATRPTPTSPSRAQALPLSFVEFTEPRA